MAKDKLCPSWPWLEHKVVPVISSAVIFYLLLVAIVYTSSKEGPLDRNLVRSRGDCKSRECNLEHNRCIVPHLRGRSSSKGNNSGCTTASREVEENQEWESPGVKADRVEERLDEYFSDGHGEVRRFRPIGTGAFLFVQFGAYRGGSNTFAVIGLGPKGLYAYGNPDFECSWISDAQNSALKGKAVKFLPDYGFGRQYTVVVVNCTFESNVGLDGIGGRLEITATHGKKDRTGLPDATFMALREGPDASHSSVSFGPPYKYDYMYCGSPLYGTVSPRMIGGWIAYHARLLGPRSHFVFYDAGGISDDVREVLNPWIQRGILTVSNIRQEARYDVYYHSQFLVNNDCLFRSKGLANWTFFFDVDEYLHVPKQLAFDDVMLGFYKMGRRAQQVLMQQRYMNHDHCIRNDSLSKDALQRQWGFEKLVYKLVEFPKRSKFGDRKYAIQAQYAVATSVHSSAHTLLPEGSRIQDTMHYDDWRLDYYHFHNTIANNGEVCKNFVNSSAIIIKIENKTHEFDNRIATLADAVRKFEIQTLGELPIPP